MATNYPVAIDTSITTLPNPTASTARNASGNLAHHIQHSNINDSLRAVETYLGTNASQTGPTATGQFLNSTAAGVTRWGSIVSGAASATVGALQSVNSNASAAGMAFMASNLSAVNVANAAVLGFSLNNSTPAEITYGDIRVISRTTTAGAESAQMNFRTLVGGIVRTFLSLGNADNLSSQFQGTTTASAGVAISARVSTTLVAAANNDLLTTWSVSSTLTPGAFTGLIYQGMAVQPNNSVFAGTKYGVYIDAQSGGTGDNISLHVFSNGGSTNNLAIDCTGPSFFTGAGTTRSGLVSGTYVGPSITANNTGGSLIATSNSVTLNSANPYGGLYVYSGAVVAAGVAAGRLAGVYISSGSGVSFGAGGTLANNNALYLETPVGGTTIRVIDSAAGFYVPTTGGLGLAGKVEKYNNVTTAGWGVPAVQAAGRSTAQTAAVASVTTYTPTADGTFEISANVLVTTATSFSFSVTCTYTDEGNTARTQTMFFLSPTAASATTLTNTSGAIPWVGVPLHIRVKANTAITIATTGTFTTVTYNVEGSVRQIA